jgi:hypothetical protein
MWLARHGKECPRKTRSTWYLERGDLLGAVLVFLSRKITKTIFFSAFIEVIHDILIPARECVEIIIEAHITPVDDEVIWRDLISGDIVRHHHRVALLFCDLIDTLDIFLDLIGELVTRHICHREKLV